MVAVAVAGLAPGLRDDAVPRVSRHEVLEALEHHQDVFVPVLSREPKDHVDERPNVVLETNLQGEAWGVRDDK